MITESRTGRRKAVSDLKRGLILDAARRVFDTGGHYRRPDVTLSG